jgi:hypothetical protein
MYLISKVPVFQYQYLEYHIYERFFNSASLVARKWFGSWIKKWSNYCKTNCQDCAISPEISRFKNAMTASSIAIPEPVFLNLLRSPGIDSQPGGIESSKPIPGLLERLQIRALAGRYDNPIPTRFLLYIC